jgi:sugar phosphate isomerase/epimerase
MARLSMNELTTFRWSFEEDVAQYLAAGFGAIGVWRQKLSDYGEEKGVELLAESGLQVSNLLWAGGFTGSDGRTFRESIEDAVEAIDLAAQLKAGCLVVYSGSRAGHTHNHARRLVKEAISELVQVAAEKKVTLAVEAMHPGCAAEFTFLTSLADSLALIEAVEDPRLKLAFDTYHCGQEPAVLDRLVGLVDRIAIVHLGDGREKPDTEQNRCRLGDGAIPLREIIAALTSAGYQGYYDIELLGEEIEASNYQQLLRQSKQVFEELTGCATH